MLFGRLRRGDPSRVAFQANAPMVSFVSLPSLDLKFSPRELTTALALCFGVADPCLADVVGVEFLDGQHRRVVDAFGYSLSAYIGRGTRRTTSHDIIVRRLESLMHFAGGQNCVERERKGVFSECIADLARRAAYLQAERKGQHTRGGACGIRPDLAADRWQWAQSPSGPSKLQLWDVKTIGFRPMYEANNRIRPVDQRASRVPPTYRLLAAKADVKWNRLPPGSDGPFQRYLASLPPVIGLAFGMCSEWSQSVDRLIGQTAELGSKCPERFGCCHGPRQAQGRVAVWMRRALHREVLREFARCRHQALDCALLRPTASYAGDPEECRRADGSPQEPGIGNVFDGSGDRAVFSGAGGRSRGA